MLLSFLVRSVIAPGHDERRAARVTKRDGILLPRMFLEPSKETNGACAQFGTAFHTIRMVGGNASSGVPER